MKNYTNKLSNTFLVLLILITIFLVLSQVFTRIFVNRQKNDVSVTNISNKQERLTQNLSKYLILTIDAQDSIVFSEQQEKLRNHLGIWQNNYQELTYSLNYKISNKTYTKLYTTVEEVLQSNFVDKKNVEILAKIIKYEEEFLLFLDKITEKYSQNSLLQTQNLQYIIFASSLIMLLSFVFVGIFIFIPATKSIKQLLKTVQKNNKKLYNKNEVLVETQEELEDRMEEFQITERNLKKNVEELQTTQEYLKKNRYELKVALAKNMAINRALDNSAAVSISNLKGEIVKVNDIFCKVSGYSKEELLGQDHRLLNSGYHSRQFWKEMWRTIRTGNTWRAEVRNRAKDGSFYWVDTVINPIQNEGGKIYQYLSIRYLITKGKKNENELKKAYEIIEKTNKAASIGTWEHDLAQNTVTWSSITKEIYEVSEDFEPNEENTRIFYKEEDYQKIRETLRTCIIEQKQVDIEFPINTANTYQKWVRAIAIPIIEGTKTVKIYGLFQDIQTQKESEKEIKKLALIAEKTDNLVIITDKNKQIEWVNESFCRFTAYSLEDVKGKKPSDFLQGKNTNPQHIQKFREGLEKQIPFSQEILNYTKSGKSYWAEINITPIFDEQGELKQYIGIAKDISERKKAEVEIETKSKQILIKNKKIARNIEILLKFSELKAIVEGDWETVVQEITNSTVKALEVDASEIWYYKSGEKQFYCMGSAGKTKTNTILNKELNPLFFRALEEGLMLVDDIGKTDLSISEKTPFILQNWQSFLLHPIYLSSRQKGLLVCYQSQKYAWENEDIIFLKSMINELEIVDQAYKRERIKEKIKVQHRKIKEINKDLKESINYASRIQNSILPKMKEIRESLPESFVFFRARDIVSGDFYFYTQRNYKTIIAAVDCTGHGIPGAFMSLIGNDLLHDIINVHNVTEPHRILTLLRREIIRTLRQKDGNNQDGMDLALCAIDHYPEEFYEDLGVPHLEYAGAGNPLIYFRDGELHKIKPDKIIIGGFNNYLHDAEFTLHRIPLDKPTTFYIFSDGIQDQFGGERKRKFSPRRLRELLSEIHEKDMKEQKNILSETIDTWQIGEKQIDDMLLIGAKV